MHPEPEGVRAGGRPEDIKAVPVRHPSRWIAALIVLYLTVGVVESIVNNPEFGWPVVGDYLFDKRILDGVIITVELTVSSMVAGVLIGVLMAVMRMSPNAVLGSVSWVYIWFFRGIPRFPLLLYLAVLSLLFPTVDLGLPFIGPVFASIDSNDLTRSAFLVGFIGLSLSEGAYMAEIVRAGMLSVDEGQAEAAKALGFSRSQALRHVILPQAMRVVVPPTGNETISMLKDTALVSVIGLVELNGAGRNISAVNGQIIELFNVVIIWYLTMTSVLYVVQYYLERRFGRGGARDLPPTPRERLLAQWRKWRPRPGEAEA